MAKQEIPVDKAARLRAYLLGTSPSASVARELWSSSTATYSTYRECIRARRRAAQDAAKLAHAAAGASGSGGPIRSSAGAGHSLPATVKYSFEGVKHVLADATAAVTCIAFANLRADLLAYGCADGELRLVGLPAQAGGQPRASKPRRMHMQAVQSIDWSYDNSQLLSVGRDGSLAVWDTGAANASGGQADGGDSEPALTCIRSISEPRTAFLCGRFHRVNPNLAMVGTSAGVLEVHNCNTGLMHSRYQVVAGGLQVTALDSSLHHVFVGDSSGTLHMYACELHGRQLSRLRPASKLRLVATHGSSAYHHHAPGASATPTAVTCLQYMPFCRATDTPVLLAALQDGSLCIVRANEGRHTAELHLRRCVPVPSRSPCPSSAPSFTARSLSSATAASAPPACASPATSAAAAAAAAAAEAAARLTLQRLQPTVCPLSVIQSVPLITFGSDDTTVYIVDVTARSFGAAAGSNHGSTGAGGSASGAGGAAVAAGDRPLTVTALKAHRAPVVCVAWSYDEALLASADADGTVVLWQRSRLF